MALLIFRLFSLKKFRTHRKLSRFVENIEPQKISKICEWEILLTPKKWVFNLGCFANISRTVCSFGIPPRQLCGSRRAYIYAAKIWDPRWKFSARWHQTFSCTDTSDLRHFGPKIFRHYVFGAEVSQIFVSVPKCLGQFRTKVHETLRTKNQSILRVSALH